MTNLRNSVMIIAISIFVLLYTVVLLGWLKPLSEVALVMRLESIIFLITGYYFGRFPAEQNEHTLKDEIDRQTKKADAAQQYRKQAEQKREELEEKLKNVKIILLPLVNNGSTKYVGRSSFIQNGESNAKLLRQSIITAINIINS